MRKHGLLTVGISVVLGFAVALGGVTGPATALAEALDGGRWVDVDDGKGYAVDGMCVTGWQDVTVNGGDRRYYFQPSGSATTGWCEVEGSTYYFRPSGSLATGWTDIDGDKYYLGEGGRVVTGWAGIDGKKYWFGDDGRMAIGWREVGGVRYYFRPSGSMATGFAQIDGVTWMFRASGIPVDGWAEWEGNKYYQDPSLGLVTGWLDLVRDDGSVARHYFRPSGVMQTGTAEIDGEKYTFSKAGALVTDVKLTTEDGQASADVVDPLVDKGNQAPTGEGVFAEDAASGQRADGTNTDVLFVERSAGVLVEPDLRDLGDNLVLNAETADK